MTRARTEPGVRRGARQRMHMPERVADLRLINMKTTPRRDIPAPQTAKMHVFRDHVICRRLCAAPAPAAFGVGLVGALALLLRRRDTA